MKYALPELVVEVTRRCNMCCDHCLRGNAQNEDLDIIHLRELLRHVQNVGGLTLTGGDPSLVPGIIRQVVAEFKAAEVSLDYFYMVTNGKQVTDKFLLALTELYLLCDEAEMCRLDISNDGHHEEIPRENKLKLEVFKFTGQKNRKDGARLDDTSAYGANTLIGEGRAKENYLTDKALTLNHFDIDDEDESINDTYIYMNVHGDIYGNCDLSFETQDALKTTNVHDEGFSLEKAATVWNAMVHAADEPTVESVLEYLEQKEIEDAQERIAA